MDNNGKFYLGRIFDHKQGHTTDKPLLYDPDDLTTHAVVLGMTGSGKTGLCIDLLEEAALNDIPALMIDPKGDITNTLLHFPNLSPADFQPWVNPHQARRANQTIEEAATETASRWKSGLADWGIGQERLSALQDAAHFAVYTPGSDVGIPINILNSLNAPSIPWEQNQEMLREKIASTVTALLGLVGLKEIDPVQSREHILLANIFEHAWSQGRDLDLSELILQTQNPPLEKLGVFDINTFFPQKDRFELAMRLNNMLAAPAFQTWLEGQPLDISSLLYGPDGRPRHSVIYIAQLPDEERMFFVTLLFSALETWMRSQSGTSSLRSLLYFDEIYGYIPPVRNPPSKQPMLRMLKQARAFGIGLVLATQNPADVDYKGLSNTGTWFIGKLQTDQDKQRLLDGLQNVIEGGMDRSEYDRLISSLGKRIFLAKNIHAGTPILFRTRWAMNYLAGPLTRAQIPALNQLVGARWHQAPSLQIPAASETIPAPEAAHRVERPSPEGSSTRPAATTGVEEYVLPNNLTFTQAFNIADRPYPSGARNLGLIYRPVLLAQANVRFLKRKYDLDYCLQHTALVTDPDRRGFVRWDDYLAPQVDPLRLDSRPDPDARFATLEAPLTEAKTMRSMERDFLDWVYQSSEVSVWVNETLKVYAGPQMSQAEFRKLCSNAARKKRGAERRKISQSYDRKIEALKNKLEREQRELASDQTELSQRKVEEWAKHAENIFSMFSKRRRSMSTSLSKRRMTSRAQADVDESLDAIEDYMKDLIELEDAENKALEEVDQRWGEIANQIEEMPVQPYKKDVIVDLFGIAWFPYHVVQVGDQVIELPGFSTK